MKTPDLPALLEALDAKRRGATSGPWVDAMDGSIETPTGGTICHVMMHANLNTVAREGEAYSHADAAYIAALPPEVVGAFIECVRAAENALPVIPGDEGGFLECALAALASRLGETK